MTKRAAIYCRVSHEEQVDGWSLDAQHELCRKLADERGWHVDPKHIYFEPGRSAKTDVRPAFQRMMYHAQAKAFDCIIVHKLDRYSRSLTDVVKNVALLDTAKVDLVSVSEPWVDSSSPMGKFMLHLFSLLAQWDNENRARETAKGKAARARAGLWNGSLAFGYTTLNYLRRDLAALGQQFERGEIDEATYIQQAGKLEAYIEKWSFADDGDAIPHPLYKEAVILAFELYKTGLFSDNDIADRLNEAGFRTTGNWGSQPFEKDTVRPMLQNRFYLGETKYKNQALPGRHEPLISEKLFNECQEVRARRRGRRARSKPNYRVYPLSRLALCAQSLQPLRGQPGNGGKTRYYRAPKRVAKAERLAMIPSEAAERSVMEYLSQIQLPDDWREQVMALANTKSDDQQTVAEKRAKLETRLERLKTLYKLGDIDEGEYMRDRSDLLNQLEALKPTGIPELESTALALEKVSDLLQHANPQEMRAIFHALLTTVYLHPEYPGYVVGIEPKPFLQELMDVSILPNWKPPKSGGDGGGMVAGGANGGIMGVVDAGENNRVADEGVKPVAPALGGNCTVPTLFVFLTFSTSTSPQIALNIELTLKSNF